jgi:hypothetical protein
MAGVAKPAKLSNDTHTPLVDAAPQPWQQPHEYLRPHQSGNGQANVGLLEKMQVWHRIRQYCAEQGSIPDALHIRTHQTNPSAHAVQPLPSITNQMQSSSASQSLQQLLTKQWKLYAPCATAYMLLALQSPA